MNRPTSQPRRGFLFEHGAFTPVRMSCQANPRQKGEDILPYWRLFYHIVWATKHRLSLIEPAWEADLHGYLRGKAIASECIPHAIGGMSDHVHVVISIPPKLPVATLIGQLKGASSHHANERYANGAFAWQAEYGVFSFSERSLSRIIEYVNSQKKHHAENTLDRTMEDLLITEQG